MKSEILLTATFPVPPTEVYEAWIRADRHSAMTGSRATSEPRVGGRFTARDGYISGKHLALVPGAHIVQSWRTAEFPTSAEDSRLEVELAPVPAGGTRLTLVHTEIPEGQAETYEEVWREAYLAPMSRFFADRVPPARPVKRRGPPLPRGTYEDGRADEVVTARARKGAAVKRAASTRKATSRPVKAAAKTSRTKPAAKKAAKRPKPKSPRRKKGRI